jgi:hypothetical protein
MQIREHEQSQYEALGEIDDARIEQLARTWARPRKAGSPRVAQRSALRELGQLSLPVEGSCPRLA